MQEHKIHLPSKPRVVAEDTTKGVYEIDALHPGYGFTLGNSLRRIILSSLTGTAITSVSISGISHEFSVIEGVKEDVVNLLLNLRQVRFKTVSDEPQTVTLSVKGPKVVTAGDIKVSGGMEVMNPDAYICEITGKIELTIDIRVEHGLGFVPKEALQKAQTEIGTISVDAYFTPIKRVSYDVENMRVGDNTNFNRLRINIETDGTISPREALTQSIVLMIKQLEAVLDFKVVMDKPAEEVSIDTESADDENDATDEEISDILKTRIDALELSARTLNALTNANIRTVGGIARKSQADLLEIEGIGEKGINEIKSTLSELGITLK
ncbi:MAG: DNA-directed RNA polymerase subunit alpha [Candidatus Pacebacteria bacterium]|nr:DNA-directed RNA polymerase subunit alpha [Candidatus Paceibacterota bacterium]